MSMFGTRTVSLARRSAIRTGLAALGLAVLPRLTRGAAVAPAPAGVPSDLSDACRAYGAALDAERLAFASGASAAERDDATDRREDAERTMVASFRSHRVGALVLDGRLYVDSWTGGISAPGTGPVAGGCVFEMANVRGL